MSDIHERIDEAERRVNELKNSPAPAGDLLIEVKTVRTYFDENGEKRQVILDYAESDYEVEDCGEAGDGLGGRHLVRSPKKGAVPIGDSKPMQDATPGQLCPWPKDGTADSNGT